MNGAVSQPASCYIMNLAQQTLQLKQPVSVIQL